MKLQKFDTYYIMINNNLQEIFTSIGGEFITSIEEIKNKYQKIKIFIFDWDGVFHSGEKNENSQSSFSEIDAMGTNLMRFSFWLKNNKQFPVVGIVSGDSNNVTAQFFAKRQFYNFYKLGAKNKKEALEFILKKNDLQFEQIAFVFDDVLDLSVAEICGLRILVRRKANPLFLQYVRENNLCDYITANQGNNNAVRETTELIMGLNENFNDAITHRIQFSDTYKEYWKDRSKIVTIEE